MMRATLDDAFDPIPAAIREVLTLFDDALSELRFPDVDADVLAGLSADVRARADDVAEARALLAAAREALEASQGVLAARARKAVHYAQVFARDDEALAERLQALAVVREAQASRKPRRRKRRSAAEIATDEAATQASVERMPELPLTDGPRLKVAAG